MLIAPAVVLQPTATLAASATPQAPVVRTEQRSVLARVLSALRHR